MSEIERMRAALMVIRDRGNYLGIRHTGNGEAWVCDIARLGLGEPPRDPMATIPDPSTNKPRL